MTEIEYFWEYKDSMGWTLYRWAKTHDGKIYLQHIMNTGDGLPNNSMVKRTLDVIAKALNHCAHCEEFNYEYK